MACRWMSSEEQLTQRLRALGARPKIQPKARPKSKAAVVGRAGPLPKSLFVRHDAAAAAAPVPKSAAVRHNLNQTVRDKSRRRLRVIKPHILKKTFPTLLNAPHWRDSEVITVMWCSWCKGWHRTTHVCDIATWMTTAWVCKKCQRPFLQQKWQVGW